MGVYSHVMLFRETLDTLGTHAADKPQGWRCSSLLSSSWYIANSNCWLKRVHGRMHWLSPENSGRNGFLDNVRGHDCFCSVCREDRGHTTMRQEGCVKKGKDGDERKQAFWPNMRDVMVFINATRFKNILVAFWKSINRWFCSHDLAHFRDTTTLSPSPSSRHHS